MKFRSADFVYCSRRIVCLEWTTQQHTNSLEEIMKFSMLATTFSGALLGMALSVQAASAAYPERPVTVVVGYSAGGATDAIARLVSQKLAAQMGQPFIVENRPGANGNIATENVANAKKDGYTVLFGGSNNVTNSSLYKKLPFDFKNDFVPVGMVALLPNILVVHPSVPVKSVGELIQYAKENPGKLNFATSGVGSSQHLSGSLFNTMAGIDITHVPYKGSAPAVSDFLGGHVEVMFDNAPSALPNVRAGKSRALGVTSATRSQAAPEIPPIAEAGLKGYDISAWLGYFVTSGVDPAIAESLNTEITKVLKDPEIRAKLLSMSTEPMGGNLEEIHRFVQAEEKKWSQAVQASGAQLD